MNQLTNKKILIFGLGMIGGSLARALKAFDQKLVIYAVDSNEEAIKLALEEKKIDKAGTLESLVPLSDIIILAVPPLSIEKILPALAEHIKPNAIVSDVASVKGHLLEPLKKFDDEFVKRFVPGHPIAGSEKSGYAASVAELFKGRNVILTPLKQNSPWAVNTIHALWRCTGANVLGMAVEKHDEVLAATSHLPHLLAYAIVDALAGQKQSEDIFRYAAGGFADFSRLASSDETMWSDIFIANSRAIEQVLDSYITTINSLKEAINSKRQNELINVFGRAKASRDKFMSKYFDVSKIDDLTTMETNFLMGAGVKDETLGVSGEFRVPGDKSISHRSIILGALASGVTRVKGFLEGEDSLNTVAAFREMGVTIVGPDDGELHIYGVGMHGLQPPRKSLYMGNSGTAMRLLAGLLAAQNFDSELTGDTSLSKRPMKRVIDPLSKMGARIYSNERGTPPLKITGTKLTGINYKMPIASAQVKSCLLLAGLNAEGVTEVIEPEVCRDHTERMLEGFGYPIERDQNRSACALTGGYDLMATEIEVPGDISSAAFFIVAATITPHSNLLLEHIGINPTRIGIILILREMGANISLVNERIIGGEPVADIRVKYSKLKGITIPIGQIPLGIDEFPVIFVAAACAAGNTFLRGAEELRVKESDRIEAMSVGLTILGVENEVFDDGIRVCGGAIGGGRIESKGDHRIAMSFAVASLRATEAIVINDCANVATSFPGFVDLAQQAGLRIKAVVN
jgi:3-phosphoshikimate 1-carboxyvinyltransferase